MKLPHWAQLLLGLAVVIITWVMQQNSSGALVLPAVAVTVLTIVKTTIGLMSDSMKTSAARAAGEVIVGIAAAFLFLRCLSACFGPSAVVPTLSFVECVAADAVEDKPIATIVTDCGQDVPAVIAAIVTSSDAKVLSSPAFGEATRAKAAFYLVDAGAQ
jgi:hypothetical protein